MQKNSAVTSLLSLTFCTFYNSNNENNNATRIFYNFFFCHFFTVLFSGENLGQLMFHSISCSMSIREDISLIPPCAADVANYNESLHRESDEIPSINIDHLHTGSIPRHRFARHSRLIRFTLMSARA